MKTWEEVGIEVPPGKHGNVKVICPRCSHTRRNRRERCLSVNVDDGLWKCWHCLWSGALGTGDRPSYGRKRVARVFVRPSPPSAEGLDPKALAWFAHRGIPREVVERNRITATATALHFPYYRGGELVNIKTRRHPKQFAMVTDAELIFYGLDDCEQAASVVVVEGEMDKLAMEVAGIKECLSVPNGANGCDPYIESGAVVFERALAVVLATDADGPGRKLEAELARRIGRAKCFRVIWPAEVKDANEALLALGPSGLRDLVVNASPYPIDGVNTPSELAVDFMALYVDGCAPGASTGWRSLDYLYTVKPGQLTVVTGTPGSGKSEFLDALMVNLARVEGWSFAVFSPENFPMERHLAKWAEKYVGKPFGKGPTLRMDEGEAAAALDWMNEHFSFVVPTEPSLPNLLELARVQVYRTGISGLVLDPWNEIEHHRPATLTETEYVGECLSEMRRFAREHGVHVWLVAHPRIQRPQKDGSYAIPTPYDISGSANFFNKADNCLTVWRDKEHADQHVSVHVQKVRFREVGGLGYAELRYEKTTGRYFDSGIWQARG